MFSGIIVNGGVKPNIIPEQTELNFYLRTPSMKELDQLRSRTLACFEGAAKATGCKVNYYYLILYCFISMFYLYIHN